MAGRKDLSFNVFPPPNPYIRPQNFDTDPNSVVEINTGLICGCMPVLKPFFRHILSKPQPDQSQQRFHTRASSIWMGKNPDDQTRFNYRNFIELERGKNTGGKTCVYEIFN
ncbi:MAG: hypothetical protein Q9161_001415 [Pseudevernia consocians]